MRDQLVDENVLEAAEIEGKATSPRPAGSARRAAASRAWRCRGGAARPARRSCARTASPWPDPAPVVHHDDERLALTFGDQVVHDQAGMALVSPAGFILAGPMLEVENGITPRRVLLVIGRGIDEAAPRRIGAL